jgi:glutamate-5-semialdehyde dehydrogenase
MFQLSYILDRFHRYFEDYLQEYDLNIIKLILSEAFTNIIKYAHQNLLPETPIEIEISLLETVIEIKIWDFGLPFAFEQELKKRKLIIKEWRQKIQAIRSGYPDDLKTQERLINEAIINGEIIIPTGGNGLFLMEQNTDKICYIREGTQKNCLIASKAISLRPEAPLMNHPDSLRILAQKTRQAALALGCLSLADRNQAIAAMAEALRVASPQILAANQADCEAAQGEGISKPLYDRLKLSESKLQATIAGVGDVEKLADPLGAITLHRELDEGLVLKRVACPLGVLGVIFEARPEALIQISSLAIKSGNGVILKGGKEALRSCQVLVEIIKQGLATTNVDPEVIQLLTTRAEIRELLTLDDYVDLIIPRGSNEFVRYIQENTRIPVLGHADGICHLYLDEAADFTKAIAITVDSKSQYPAACNAVETLLVNQAIAATLLPQLALALQEKQVVLKGDPITQTLINCEAATEEDWRTEYSDLILAIKVVDSLAAAIEHIHTYGSKHTEAIVTENRETAQVFLNQVDAAGVYHNCSTRFADGFRYGFGAEVGISTQKMPPRGPVGLEGLVTYKYQLQGNGQIVAHYSGSEAKAFSHRDLEL